MILVLLGALVGGIITYFTIPRLTSFTSEEFKRLKELQAKKGAEVAKLNLDGESQELIYLEHKFKTTK